MPHPETSVFILPFQDLASLEKVKKMKILPFSTHQNLKISEIRAKIKGKMLKTSNIKQKFRLRRAKSVKNNLNTSISILKKSPPEGRRFFLPFLKSNKKTLEEVPASDDARAVDEDFVLLQPVLGHRRGRALRQSPRIPEGSVFEVPDND